VFENRVLRRIFGPKRDEVTGGWRKLHNEELHGLYSSPSIVRVIKARRMRWTCYVARMGEMKNAYIWLESQAKSFVRKGNVNALFPVAYEYCSSGRKVTQLNFYGLLLALHTN
jgi:hypothetical protein